MRFLTIDPSIRKLGWALFTVNNNNYEYERSGVITCDLKDWKLSAFHMANETISFRNYTKAVNILIEEPNLFHGNSKGEGAKNSGAVLKLFGLVMVLQYEWLKQGLSVETVAPIKWKGNISKKVKPYIIQTRMEKRYCTKVKDDNEADALGLGDWKLRKILKKKLILP